MSSRRALKGGLGRVIFRSGAHRRLLDDRAVIVTFHRVRDDLHGDPITCGTDEFVEYCSFFREYFDVLPLARLVDRLDRGDDISGCLSITFDDGYRDNYEVAADILDRFSLPACFFISSGLIGTDTVPPWDAKNNVDTRWMGWHQVAELSEAGHTIGAHTVSHCDLGVIRDDRAKHEIQQSKADLEDHLGHDVDFFSYPFGGPDHLSTSNACLVREAGFRRCFSACGGLVRSEHDRMSFVLDRLPVSRWHLSSWQWGTEALLTRFRPSTRWTSKYEREFNASPRTGESTT